MAITQTLTTFPDPPRIYQPEEEFDANADEMAGHLPILVNEINALIPQINSASTDINTKHGEVVTKHDQVMTTAGQISIDAAALSNAVTSAQSSASSASSSASSATTSKNAAATSATNAATSAANAANAAAQSANNAASSVAAIYDVAAHPNVYIFNTTSGQPSFFYAFPRCTWLDLMPDGSLGYSTHQAFLEDGVQRDVLYISMYPLSLKNGEVVSQPNSVPHTDATLDEEKAICAATQLSGYANKHRMMSIWDWSLVAHWCLANGIQPIGNTNYGRPHEAGMGHIRGIAPTGAYTLTGTMGAKSSHNQTNAGVFDLVGNVWTRLDKMLLQDGRIRIYADNGSAGFIDQNLWINSSVAAGYGTPSITTSAAITAKAAGYYDYVAFGGLTGGTILLQQAMLAPLNARTANGIVLVINTGSRAPLRGGGWGYTSDAGLGTLHLNNAPSYRYSGIGFRSAFVL
jgi:hypothetical protein